MKTVLIFMFLLFVGYHPTSVNKVDEEKPFDQLIEETNLLKRNVLELKEKVKP